MRAPRRDRAERPLLVLALLAGSALLALYFAVVRTYWGQRLDEHAFVGRAVIGGRPAEGADDLLSIISTGTLALAIVGLIALALLRGKPALALLALLVVAGSLLVTEVLKLVVLERPPLVPSAVLDNSFPSGHATIGIAVGLAMVMVVPAGLRVAAGIGAAILGAGVGIATVAAGWHRPSDAVAACLVALAVAAALSAAMLRWGPGEDVEEEPAAGSRPHGLARLRLGTPELILGVLSLGAGGLFLLALLRAEGVPWTSAGVGFLLSAGAIAASAAIAAAALVATLGRRGDEAPGA